MSEGRKDDADKVRIDLFPPEAIFAISRVLTFGAKKYDDRNWEKGMSWGRVFGAAMRHAWAWWGGKGPTTKSFLFGDLDEETKFSHLWHLGCCVVFLIAYEERGAGVDDRFRRLDKQVADLLRELPIETQTFGPLLAPKPPARVVCVVCAGRGYVDLPTAKKQCPNCYGVGMVKPTPSVGA